MTIFFEIVGQVSFPSMTDSNNILLLIDVQEDFHDKPGSHLPVVNSMEDAQRIIKMIETDIKNFEKTGSAFFKEIHMSMDSHLTIHIGHAGFWKRVDGIPVTPGVVFALNADDKIVNAYDFDGALSNTIIYEADEPCLQKWAVEYIRIMTTQKNIHPLIWNQHCIRNQPGWLIEESIMSAIMQWNQVTGGELFFHEKGENILTEMYSIMSATVPYEELIQKFDKKTQDEILDYTCIPGVEAPFPEIRPYQKFIETACNMATRFNEPLFRHLCGNAGNQKCLYIAGQAKSHCVNASARDIVNRIEEISGMTPSKVVIIEDLMSNVVLPGNEYLTTKFKEDGDAFIRDMRLKRVQIILSENVV